jgi:Fe-S-cluster containining protein
MQETIDLIAMREAKNLRRFTRETGQPTTIDKLDLTPMERVHEIEITEEHVTIKYQQTIGRAYNVNHVSYREWTYKYNDDPRFVDAVRTLIELSREEQFAMPENVACPPGCAECCSGYEPFVNKGDVQRIADHLGLSYAETMRDYVVERASADGFVVGWLRKVSDDTADKCQFLKGSGSGRYYCGIYEARPDDCREFTPIGCQDVDRSLPHGKGWVTGPAFTPKRRRK